MGLRLYVLYGSHPCAARRRSVGATRSSSRSRASWSGWVSRTARGRWSATASTRGCRSRRRRSGRSRRQSRDGWIADGTIGDPARPNAADLQLASTVRLLMTLVDARPLIDGRRCAELATALFPDTDGVMPAGSLPTV